MMLPLTDKETAIMLGASLMRWGVPFHSATKHELTDEQQAIVDVASDKLMAVRESNHRSPLQEARDVSLSDDEIALFIEVIDDCLAECGDDATELHLQLHTTERQEVETLVGRLRRSIQPCLVTNN